MVRDKESIAKEIKFLYYTLLTTSVDDSYERELHDGRYQ